MNPFLDQAQFFTRMWLDFASKMTTAGLGIDPTDSPPEMARQMRGNSLQALSQFTEQFMRAPEFLEFMRQSVDAGLNFRKQFNDFLTRMRHDTQGVARQDVDAVLASIKHVETRVLDSIEELHVRLDVLTRRLDNVEGAAHRGNGNGEKDPAAPARTERPSRRARERTRRDTEE